MGRGFLISFEGLDGAGKTTQIDLFTHWLERMQIPYVRTREPGGTALGLEIRQLLFQHPELAITPLAEAFLFQSDRAQHFEKLVLPALADGKVVISDRCFDSSIAYQGVAQGVGSDIIEQLSLLATQGHIPDLTFFLDLDPLQVYTRTSNARQYQGEPEEQSRFDRESVQFHSHLRQAFLALEQAHPQRIKRIDAVQAPEKIQQAIVALAEKLLL
jgi:dTMP kinase